MTDEEQKKPAPRKSTLAILGTMVAALVAMGDGRLESPPLTRKPDSSPVPPDLAAIPTDERHYRPRPRRRVIRATSGFDYSSRSAKTNIGRDYLYSSDKSIESAEERIALAETKRMKRAMKRQADNWRRQYGIETAKKMIEERERNRNRGR